MTVFLSSFVISSNASTSQKKLNILFIGNSFTYFLDVPEYFLSIADSKGKAVSVDYSVCKAGYSLKQHWDDGVALDLIKSKKWDYVVLQENGGTPLTNKEEFYKYVRLFDKEIKAVNSKTVLYITTVSPTDEKTDPNKQNIMTESYVGIGKEIKSLMVPSGPAWANLYKVTDTIPLYATGDYHQSELGAYMIGSVFYATIFNDSPEGASSDFTSEKYSSSTISLIQKTAWTTVTDFYKAHEGEFSPLPTPLPPTPTPTTTPTPANKSITIKVDKTVVKFTYKPILIGKYILAQAEPLAKAMKATYKWDSKKKSIKISKGKKVLTLNINSNYAYINGNKVKLATPAKIEKAPFIYIEFLAKNLGYSYKYDSKSKCVYVT